MITTMMIDRNHQISSFSSVNFALAALFALIVMVPALAPAHAQVSQSPNPAADIPAGNGPRETRPKYEVPCGPCYAVSYVDPHLAPNRPRRKSDGRNNHKTIEAAIANTRPDGLVIVYRDRESPFTKPFTVSMPGITIRGATEEEGGTDGGTIVVRQEADTCLTIAPKGTRRFSNLTTTIIGFTFLTNNTASKPCIMVDKGTLVLKDSRVDIGRSDNTAINVGAIGELEFTGSNYDEHGIFAGQLSADGPSDEPVGRGIVAEKAKSINLSAVRLQGLSEAIMTGAEQNRFTNVDFAFNGTAIKAEDTAIVSAYAPNITVTGGLFRLNRDGIILTANEFAGSTLSSGLSSAQTGINLPYKGKITLDKSATDPVSFFGNERAITFLQSFPRASFKIANANFTGNRQHAIQLILPYQARADFSDIVFNQNGMALSFKEPLNGDLYIDKGTTLYGEPVSPATPDPSHGVWVTGGGRGRIFANFEAVFGVYPAIHLSKDYLGRVDMTVRAGSPKAAIAMDEDADLCRYDLRKKKERASFALALEESLISVNGQSLGSVFMQSDTPASRNELQEVEDYICGRVIPGAE